MKGCGVKPSPQDLDAAVDAITASLARLRAAEAGSISERDIQGFQRRLSETGLISQSAVGPLPAPPSWRQRRLLLVRVFLAGALCGATAAVAAYAIGFFMGGL